MWEDTLSAKDVGTQIYESLREHASSCYAPLSSGTIKTYQDWRYTNDPDFVAIPCDQDDICTVLRHVVDIFMGTNSLIILDVCPSGQEIKNMTSEVVQLGFSARHYRLFTIVVTQQLTSVAKPYRENISKLVTFYTSNRNDMKNDCGRLP